MKKLKVISVSIFLYLFSCSLFSTLIEHRMAEAIETPALGGIYRRPLEFAPGTFDPSFSTDIYGVSIIQQIFDGLVQFDKNLNIIPGIAKSWTISPDGLTYTFFLREGVRFHNQREVTSEHVIYSFTRIMNPSHQSPAAPFFSNVLGSKEFQGGTANHVAGFRSRGKYVFEIKLSAPYSPLISALGINHFKVVPREEIEKPGSLFAKAPVGTGPFRFASMKEGEEIVLEANPDYFEGRPLLDKIIFRIFQGAPREKILREFKEGGLEEAYVPPEEIGKLLKEKRYPFFQKPSLSLRFYGFNVLSKPLDNKKLRKAISFAIDKKRIISAIHKNQFNLSKSILPPGMPGYDPLKDFYPFDQTQALKLLAEAGFPKGRGIPPLEIWSSSSSEAAQRELKEIKSQLNTIGIQTTIRFETNWPNFESLLRNRKAPIFIYAWYADIPDPDNFLGILFHSRSRYNYMAYQNLEVDRLLDQARTERDYLTRMEMYRRIEEMVLDDAPIVPMVNHLFQAVYQPYVRGIELNVLGGAYVPMKRIWFQKGE